MVVFVDDSLQTKEKVSDRIINKKLDNEICCSVGVLSFDRLRMRTSQVAQICYLRFFVPINYGNKQTLLSRFFSLLWHRADEV